jgi:ATP-dependent RNA helicase RhlE
MKSFSELKLSSPIMQALEKMEYVQPTPIQVQAIPLVLEGRDLFGCAQTGTGKTAAFALPLLQLLSTQIPKQGPRRIQALILAPTRELAAQIGDNITSYREYLSVRHVTVFGGVGQKPQVKALQQGTDILVATPGRLLDLMQQGFVTLEYIRYFVLDEADRMLDMGFIQDIRRIILKLPKERQTLFFSATASPPIQKLAATLLRNPARVSVDPVSSATELVTQEVYFVDKDRKRTLLKQILEENKINHALVFTRTKRGADRVSKELKKSGILAEAIHGDKSQIARVKALDAFKNRRIRVLVATDVASRGIDVDQLSHVINYEIPEVAETYVHRIGRTGRAGASGVAISMVHPEEMAYWRDIEKLLGRKIPLGKKMPGDGR